MKKAILKIYGALIIWGITYFIIIKTTGYMLPCYIHQTTGLLCPGCGITRMFLNLAKFNISDAFFSNPVIFVIFTIWITISVICFIGKPKILTKSKFLYSMFYVSIFTLFIFGILRNITWQNTAKRVIIITQS